MIPGQRLEPGRRIPMPDIGPAVHHHHGRPLAPPPELPDEQRDVSDIHQRITHAARIPAPSDNTCPIKELEKSTWTAADFEVIGWHDCRVPR